MCSEGLGCVDNEGVMVREATTGIAAMTEHSGSEEGTCIDSVVLILTR